MSSMCACFSSSSPLLIRLDNKLGIFDAFLTWVYSTSRHTCTISNDFVYVAISQQSVAISQQLVSNQSALDSQSALDRQPDRQTLERQTYRQTLDRQTVSTRQPALDLK